MAGSFSIWPVNDRFAFFNWLFAGIACAVEFCGRFIRITAILHKSFAHLFLPLPWGLVLASGSPVKMNAREPNQAQNSESSVRVISASRGMKEPNGRLFRKEAALDSRYFGGFNFAGNFK